MLLLTTVASADEAADRRYSIGIHDFIVADADSHTYGLNVSASIDKRTAAGRHWVGSFDLFLDRDKDDLDPDHIPIWWQVHLGTDGDWWRSDAMHVGWSVDINTRMNTVSSIERQITALPKLVAGYDGTGLRTSLQAGAGWFFLEIDDDVPRTRGYDRDDFRNSELAYTLAADATVRLGTSWSVFGQAQQWWDSHEWLQTVFRAAVQMDAGHSSKGSEFALSADYNKYNLEVYSHPDLLPILPWDDDLMIRLSFSKSW
ncbi:MAG TPA: hypothetical protein VGN07_22825 [Steroidobacteraceae bacterium]